jgi:hypothetical protein
MQSVSKKALLSTALGLSLIITGCGGSSNNSTHEAEAQLRVVHASPDAPKVNVSLDGSNAITNLDYSESSGYLTVEAKSYDIVVEGVIPSGNADVITVNGFALNEDDRVTVFAIDTVSNIQPLVINDSAAIPSASEVAVNVIHAAPAAPAVDIYVTTPGADIAAIDPAFSFAFTENVDAGNLAAGSVQIRATLAGTKTVAYDSGTVDLGGFAGQSILLAAIATTNETAEMASIIKLLAVADNATLTLFDENTMSGVKVVHASPDAAIAAGGPVEVFATSAVLGASAVELIDGFSYTDVIPAVNTSVAVPAATDYAFDVAPDTDNIGDSVFNVADITLNAGEEYTVVAAGLVTSTPSFSLLLTADDNRPIATQARLKVIHAAPAAGTVDVYVTPAGTVSTADILNTTPALGDFEYGTITDYIDLPVGTFDVRVVAGGNVAINVEGLSLTAGLVATAIARGPLQPSGAPNDFGLLLLTN